MSNVSKDKIVEALEQLDPANPAHWTDDGLPVTKYVQQLTGDDTLKRVDITEAAPGFGKDTATAPKADPVTGVIPISAKDAENFGDDLRAKLESDLAFATQECERLSQEVYAKQKEHGLAIKARDKAMLNLNSKFPPMDAATAIKQHLESELNKRIAAAGGTPGAAPASQLDRTMSGRKAPLGWNTNVRDRGRMVPTPQGA